MLIGFMGAGKTTVGRLLAQALGWHFADTDALLVQRHGAAIADIFEKYGEKQFRDWEAACVAETLASNKTVAALGGGAVEHPQTRELLHSRENLVVFLETPLDVSLQRCNTEPGAAVRPILQAGHGLNHRLKMRLPWYRSAHLTLATEGKTPAELARAIASAVRIKPPTLS